MIGHGLAAGGGSAGRRSAAAMLCVALAVAAPAWAQSPVAPARESAGVDPGDYGSVYLRMGHWIYAPAITKSILRSMTLPCPILVQCW